VNFLTGVRPGIPFQTSISPVGRPLGGEIRQLLLAGEYFALEVSLLDAEGGDAILCVDCECCHFLLLLTAVAVMAFITLKPRTKQLNSADFQKKKLRREISRA
jgi:hypothetical protein